MTGSVTDAMPALALPSCANDVLVLFLGFGSVRAPSGPVQRVGYKRPGYSCHLLYEELPTS